MALARRRTGLSPLQKVATAALLATACVAPKTSGQTAEAIQRDVVAVTPKALESYRWFHSHPELSNAEHQTAAYIAEQLEALDLDVRRGVGGTGVVGVLRGRGPAKGRRVVLYRADMDALPLTERTGLPYASEEPGVMHACGHDLHLAIALGALEILANQRSSWSGTVIFVAQPAEEIGAGARQILDDPRFAELLEATGKPDVAFALHDAADLPAGQIGLSPGWATANVDAVDVVIHGRGGHGARPHEAIDPIVIGAEIVMALQTIVSRRLPAGTRAVVTVGQFDGGTKRNIIPASATLKLTVRSYEAAVRNRLMTEIERTAVSVANAHGVERPPEIKTRKHYTPAGYNDPEWTERLHELFRRTFGADAVTHYPAVMTGEDFARYSKRLGIPGVQWRLGAAPSRAEATTEGEGQPGLHSDRWAPDAVTALPVGIRSALTALVAALGPGGP